MFLLKSYKPTSLYSILFCLLIFSSCQKDDVPPTLIVENTNDMEISTRSSVIDCHNFIMNGDFSEFTPQGNNPCTGAFLNSINHWSSALGSPDLFNFNGNCSVANLAYNNALGNGDICLSSTDLAYMHHWPMQGGVEGIMTTVNLDFSAEIWYTLELDVDDDFVILGTVGYMPITDPITNINHFQTPVIVSDEILLIGPGDCNNPTVFNWNALDPLLPQDFNQIIIFPDNNPMTVDNVSLTCENENYTGIHHNNIDKCKYEFAVLFNGNIDNEDPSDKADKVYWDFGDGNCSVGWFTDHTFANGGNHLVTVTIIDKYNCCTTKNLLVNVECNNISDCISYICWEDLIFGGPDGTDPDCNDIECFAAVELQLPDGNIIIKDFINMTTTQAETEIAEDICNDSFFNEHIPADVNFVGGHCEIAIQILRAINDVGFPADFQQGDPNINCTKGSNVLPGFFFTSEVKILSLIPSDCGMNDYYDCRSEFLSNGNCN